MIASQSGVSLDLLDDCKSESSALEWDYKERPLTQTALKQSVAKAHQEFRNATWAATPTLANATVWQELLYAPMPFTKMRRPKYPPRHVASEFICHKCSCEINVWHPLQGKHCVFA